MPEPNDGRTAKRFCGAALVFAVAAYAAGAVLVPPAMFSDSGWGFAVLRSMERGAPFNWTVQADPQDIARDSGGFLTTWTPGQYLIPGLIAATGLPLGHALTVTTVLFSVLGLAGWYRLYAALGFSARIRCLAIVLIAFNRFFVLPFGIYNGGEVLLFGWAPFMFLGGMKAAAASRIYSVALVPLFLIGFFLKNSALIVGMAVCAANVALAFRAKRNGGQSTGWYIWPAVFLTTYAAAYVLYTSRGWTPVGVGTAVTDRPIGKGLFAICGPLLSALSIDDGLSRLLLNPGSPIYPDWQYSLPSIVPLALVSCGVYGWLLRRTAGTYYGNVLLAVLGVYVSIFVALNVLGSAVSSTTEARHYRPAGLILLPGLVAAVTENRRRFVRRGGAVIGLLACLYGVSSYAHKWQYLRGLDSVGARGFTQTSIDRDALQWLRRADSEHPSGTALFFLTSPELGLEVDMGRIILTHADFETLEMHLGRVYRGSVGHLFVVLPERFEGSGKKEAILNSFVDYDRWDGKTVGAYRIYSGNRKGL